MPAEVERKLAAILSADVVGYSRLMAEDEAGTIRTVTAYRNEISGLVGDHRGRVVDTAGDSVLAELLYERLLRVAPLDIYFRALRVIHLYIKREYERGIAEAERIRELHPEFVDASIAFLYFLLGRPEDFVRESLAYFARGGARFDRAREAFQRGSEEGGLRGGLRALTRLQIELTKRGAFGRAYLIAFESAIIGETEEAMTWLERAYEERDPFLLVAKTDPLTDPLRSDPRFQDLLRRIGFPES